MATPAGLSGPEREWAKETQRIAPSRFPRDDPHRLWVPFGALARDLNVASAGAGGYLVDAVTLPARDILRPWSVTLQGGVTMIESLTSNAFLPMTSGTVSVQWMSTESAQASPSTPALAQAALTPKTAIGVIVASRQFMQQADPEAWIRRELLRTCGVVIDTAVLNGSGASGQPLGVLNAPGISTQSGTSLAWSGVLAMKRNAAAANAQDGTIAFLATPAVRELLEARERASGGGTFIWQDDRIAACPAFATTLMPAATLLCGPLGEVVVGLWGGGITVEVDPYTQFQTGRVQIRVLVSCDVAIGCDRAAFTRAASIT